MLDNHNPVKIRFFFAILCLLYAFSFFPSFALLPELGIYPLQVELGGRPLGMGGAFAGISDLNSAFYNPAGLAWAKGLELSIKNAGTLAALQAFPLGQGSSIGLTVATSNTAEIPFQGGVATSTSNVVYCSYGTKLSLLPRFFVNPIFQRMAIGVNIKGLMQQTLQRTGLPDNSGSGWDMDLGILWKGAEWWSLGGALQNLVPAGTLGSGGQVKWNSGDPETLPSNLKIGGAAKIMGDVYSPIYNEEQELLLAGELNFTSSALLLRLGGEWSISRQYFLRAGFLQQEKNRAVSSGLNCGVGGRWGQWGVDLALFRDIVKEQHCLLASLLYFPKDWVVIKKLEVKKPAVIVKDVIEKISLAENIVVNKSSIEVFGRVKPGVAVYINGLPVAVDKESNFKTIVPLSMQKNFIIVEAVCEGERKIWKYKILRKAQVDLAEKNKTEHELKDKIEILATMGVIEIATKEAFVVETGITRGELATWISKAAGISLPTVLQNPYPDVKKSDPLAPYIKVVKDLQLLPPFPDGTFRPNAMVSDEEGKAVFAKFGVGQ